MTVVPAKSLEDAFVGDTGPIIALYVFQIDAYTARDLTGYSVWFRFWYGSDVPHVTRAGVLFSANPAKLYYYLQGDEYYKVGTCWMQATICPPDWVTGVSTGRNFQEASLDLIARRILARPA